MLLLQDFYDEFLKGSSSVDKGTLRQLKNLYNFCMVKTDISDKFNYAWELMYLNTEGCVCLLAMSMLNMDSLDNVPEEAPVLDDSTSFEEKSRYLESVCSRLVKKVWHETDTSSLRKDDDQGIPLFCCGEEKDESLIECGERANCPNGEVFHCLCVGIEPDDLPDDWFCGEECKRCGSFYSYCHCQKNLGPDEPMIARSAEKSVWVHIGFI